MVELAARAPSGGVKGDAAKLAPIVVLADFVEVVTGPPDPAGRRFSTIRYRVVEPLKFALPRGTLIRAPGGPTYYPDGTMGMSTADTEMIQPGRYLLYLSREKISRGVAPTPPADLYGRVFGPLRSFQGKFGPVGESSHPVVTLDELRAAIAEQRAGDPTVRITNGDGR